LRGQLLDLSVRAAEIEKIVGKNHLAVVKLRDRMEDVRQAIASEQKRIVAAFNRDYELASLRYKEVSAAVDQVIRSEGAQSNKVIGLRALEGSLESLRTLYNRMLLQVGDMNRVDAQPSIAPDARVLNRAEPPLQTESSKKRLLILASGSVLGLLLGGA